MKNRFFPICQIFGENCFSVTYFLTNFSFLSVETDFLRRGNSILPFRALLKFLKFVVKRLFKRIFNSVWWRRIFCLVETGFFYLIFFLQVETITEISENLFFGKDFIPLNSRLNNISSIRKGFPVQWKLFSFIHFASKSFL